MNPTLKKTIAVLMVCVTTIGILLSLFFLVQTWRIRQPVTDKLQSAFIQTSSLLQTTVVGLDVIDQVVTNVYSSTLYISDSTNALAQTIENTDQFFESAGSFVGEGINNTITNTQRTLESAQSSAFVIDNILTTLSKVPLIGINYNPSVPLSTALGEVSASLDPLQESLKGFQDNLVSTQSNLQVFVDQLELLEQNIAEINQNLASSQAVIEKYQTQVISVKAWVDKAIISMPTWVTTMCVIITIIILLLILVQAGIMLQGIYLFTSPNTSVKDISVRETSAKDTGDIETSVKETGQIEISAKETGE
jgi:hypothetical protein